MIIILCCSVLFCIILFYYYYYSLLFVKIILSYPYFLTFFVISGSGTRCFALQDGETISTSLTTSFLHSLLSLDARTHDDDSTDNDSEENNSNNKNNKNIKTTNNTAENEIKKEKYSGSKVLARHEKGEKADFGSADCMIIASGKEYR